MVINAKRVLAVLSLLVLVIAGIFGIRYAMEYFYRQTYPKDYEEYVLAAAKQNEIDPDLLWAIIKTESDFEPNATSNVGARGLMQIMQDTYDWIRSKLGDSGGSYDDMYDPEQCIRYGAFLVGYLYREFGSYDIAAAAYHAGRTATGKWLKNPEYSKDGVTLDKIPIRDTDHYVGKVMRAYKMYQKLYKD